MLLAFLGFTAASGGACGGKRDGRPEPGRTAAEVRAPGEVKPGPKVAVPPPPIEPPSDAECERAIANMKGFMPDDVPGDADDKSQCLGMPRPVVLCLQKARSVDDVDACVDRYAAQQGAAPAETRASEGECREAMANVRKLVPDMSADPAQLVKDCVAMAGAAEVRCLRDAKSKEDLDKCESLAD